jgi:hypothetical protein
MRTSKDLFQTSPAFRDFQALRASAAFEPACNAAILGLIESLPTAADPAKAWDCYLQIVGARKAFEILSRLHEPDEERKPEAWPTLNYGNTPKKP